MKHLSFATFVTILSVLGLQQAAFADCSALGQTSFGEWQKTDFTKCIVDPMEIISGGPRKDGILAISKPKIIDVAAATISPRNPVIVVEIDDKARAYPLEVMMWHEIANDILADQPISVTYCPLCNAAIVFDREFEGKVLDFGVTGRLRFSDMIMYDRQTESWWQQYGGTGLIGDYAGKELNVIPSVISSFADFATQHPNGTVLVPNNPNYRQYGSNPYVGYDTSVRPFLFNGETPSGIAPLERVLILDDTVFSFDYLRRMETLIHKGKLIQFHKKVRSVLGNGVIDDARDVGTVSVTKNGKLYPHKVAFAFVAYAFESHKKIIH